MSESIHCNCESCCNGSTSSNTITSPIDDEVESKSSYENLYKTDTIQKEDIRKIDNIIEKHNGLVLNFFDFIKKLEPEVDNEVLRMSIIMCLIEQGYLYDAEEKTWMLDALNNIQKLS